MGNRVTNSITVDVKSRLPTIPPVCGNQTTFVVIDSSFDDTIGCYMLAAVLLPRVPPSPHLCRSHAESCLSPRFPELTLRSRRRVRVCLCVLLCVCVLLLCDKLFY